MRDIRIRATGPIERRSVNDIVDRTMRIRTLLFVGVSLLWLASAGQGQTLFSAAHGDQHIIALSLLEAGVDANRTNEMGETPLFAAVRQNARKVTVLLVRAGAEVNRQDRFGNTPLHIAARHNSLRVAKILLKHGADPNHANNRDGTPLDLLRDAHTGQNAAKLEILLMDHMAKQRRRGS